MKMLMRLILMGVLVYSTSPALAAEFMSDPRQSIPEFNALTPALPTDPADAAIINDAAISAASTAMVLSSLAGGTNSGTTPVSTGPSAAEPGATTAPSPAIMTNVNPSTLWRTEIISEDDVEWDPSTPSGVLGHRVTRNTYDENNNLRVSNVNFNTYDEHFTDSKTSMYDANGTLRSFESYIHEYIPAAFDERTDTVFITEKAVYEDDGTLMFKRYKFELYGIVALTGQTFHQWDWYEEKTLGDGTLFRRSESLSVFGDYEITETEDGVVIYHVSYNIFSPPYFGAYISPLV